MTTLGNMEKWTLRFAVVALLFLALSGFEGMLMRSQQYNIDSLHGMEALLNNLRPGDVEPTTAELYYAMLSAHPIVGIYGFVYMAVFGAFYFLVPYLIQKPVKHPKLVVANFWLQIIGVMTCWAAGFFGLFNAMYTLYWPLPVAFDRVPVVGSIFFMLGAAAIMVNILLFSYNIFKTVLSKNGEGSYTIGQFLRAAFGIPRLLKLFGKEDKTAVNLDYNGLPPFIVAVARGSIDTVINAIVLLSAGVLILVYGLFALFGHPLNPLAVDALIYKNIYWWGLDMVADGNALIYTA
ncbi:MAG TPA: cbb3-type cytochrome c oxidase subunit I, partial [Anaerolineaceae bacterium]|nr:cbb3-type cytochrome c oxidase subunit I [Anaerolineaceae bacterium]